MPSHRRPDSGSENDLLASLVDAWLAGLRSENTRAAYRRDMAHFVMWCRAHGRLPLEASPADMSAFQTAARERALSEATIGRQVSSIASFFRFASAQGRAVESMTSVERPRQRAASDTASLRDAQANAVWSSAVTLGPKAASIVGLVLYDGLKVTEALMLDVSDVSAGRPTHVGVAARGGARVRLDPRTAGAVRVQLDGRRGGPLFLGGGAGAARRMTRFGADYLIRRAGQHAGLDEPLNSNTLRRTHMVAAHARGTSLDEIRGAVGHADTRTTRRYLPGPR